jgi:hypothetical protein
MSIPVIAVSPIKTVLDNLYKAGIQTVSDIVKL